MANLFSLLPIITIILCAAIIILVEANSYNIDVPIQIIKPAQDNQKLELVESNLIHLSKLSGPVVIVAVVGKYQAERPFLMNQLMGKSTGFGYSVQPKTMGIWMWGQPVVYGFPSSKHKINLLFLDTGGFSTSNATDNYDARVFAVSTLLSSHLLYNSVKIIDQSDIDHLISLARRAKLFVPRSALSNRTVDSSDDMPTFPPLTWVVQDFAEESRDNEKPEESSDRLMGGGHTTSLFKSFKGVDCHKLPVPALDGRHLSEPKDNDLSPDYRRKLNQLIRKLRLVRPKEKGGHNYLTGPDLAQLLRALVNAANDGPLASVHSRWRRAWVFFDSLRSRAVKKCTAFYNQELEKFLMKNYGEPVDMQTYELQHRQVKAKAFELLDKQLDGPNYAATKLDLLGTINEIFLTKWKLNHEKIKAKCKQVKAKLILNAERELKEIRQPLCGGSFRRRAQSICSQSTQSLNESLANLGVANMMPFLSRELEESLEQLVMSVGASNELLARAKVQDVIREIFDKRDGNCSDEMTIKQSAYDNILDLFFEENEENCKTIDEIFFDSWLVQFQQELSKIRDDCYKKTLESASERMENSVKEYSERFASRLGGKYLLLPIGRTDFFSISSYEESILVKNFETQFADFADCCDYESHLNNLKLTIRIMADEKYQKNIDARKASPRG